MSGYPEINSERISGKLGLDGPYESVSGRWEADAANAWYADLPFLAGTNYYPSTAINQIEMWQASTWDPDTIRKEMAWAEKLGFNTHRVYLHDLVWEDDEQGLYARMDDFLSICADHGIRPFFVFFDDCHFPRAALGPQPLPVPAYHNSGWVTCPERACALRFSNKTAGREEVTRLKGYVQNTMKQFKNDSRVLMWELYNEPGRGNGFSSSGSGDLGSTDFGNDSAHLVHQSWMWAREISPSQPVCSNSQGCVGDINWAINVLNSDVQSIHCYGNPEEVRTLIRHFREYNRPLFMTEYLAREFGSTFQDILPILKQQRVAAINWGFVAGKTGTIWPWSSRTKNGQFVNADILRERGEFLSKGDPVPEPDLWFHDLLREDGRPFDPEEIKCIQSCMHQPAETSG